MSLRKRIQVLLLFLVAIPLLLLLWESYRAGRKALLSQLKVESVQVARLEVAGIDLAFDPPRVAAEGLARNLSSCATFQADEILPLVEATLHENPDLYGVAVALDPAATPLGRFAPYAFRRGGVEKRITLPYEYTRWDWYRLAVESGRGAWVKPYYDEGGGDTVMVTHSVPIRRAGRIVGVATVDLDLDGLIARLRKIRPGGGGTVYLANRSGMIVAHPELKALVDFRGQKDLGTLDELMKHRGEDMTEMVDPVSKSQSWVVEAPIGSLSAAHGGQDWSLIVSWPLKKRLALLSGLGRRMLVLYLFLGGAALLFLNRSFDQVITRPVRRLTEQARRYAGGDFRPGAGGAEEAEELRDLSRALESLGEALGKRGPGPPAP